MSSQIATLPPQEQLHRWECRCADRPILMARYSDLGEVELKFRDRYYTMVVQELTATCPRCHESYTLSFHHDAR